MGLFSKDTSVEEENESAELRERVEALESHFNALDSAVQHHDIEIQEIVDTITADERNLKKAVEKNKRKLDTLRDISSRFAEMQSENTRKTDILDSEVADIKRNMKRKIIKKAGDIKETREKQEEIIADLEGLKEKVDDLETELILDINSQAWDVDSKLDESRFENRKKRVDKELSKLRASINDISDKFEGNDIRTE